MLFTSNIKNINCDIHDCSFVVYLPAQSKRTQVARVLLKRSIAMFNFDYPKIKHSLARTALQDPYPAWFFDTRGVIRGANLMAFWISETVKLNEPIKADVLLGRSIFGIFSNSFERIPIEQNIEFYSKKSSMLKRMKTNSHVESAIYDNFIAAMRRDPLLEKIYEEALL